MEIYVQIALIPHFLFPVFYHDSIIYINFIPGSYTATDNVTNSVTDRIFNIFLCSVCTQIWWHV